MVVILQGQSVSAPATVTKTDWSSRPGDLGALWIAGGTLSPADFSMSGISMSSTSGSDVKLTGKTTLAVEGNTPPDLPILGRGGAYEITFGLYNKQFGLIGSEPTDGLLKNTLMVGKPMLDPTS